MNFTRYLRKQVTYRFLKLGQQLAQRGDHANVEHLRKILIGFTEIAVPLRRRLEWNMKLTGIYQSHLTDAHFERAIDQMIMLAHVFRAGFPKSGCPERFCVKAANLRWKSCCDNRCSGWSGRLRRF